MSDLVFIGSQSIKAEPYTTSDVVSEYVGIRHDKIKSAIVKQKSALETFGKLTPYGDTLGGRGNKGGYQLNEPQATLLITFLKNTPEVVAFKTELVRQFYAMRRELTKRQIARAQSKPPQRTFTDVIKACTPPEHLHPYTYSNYVNLAFKAALGLSAHQLRQQRHIPDAAIIEDYMTDTELDAVTDAKGAITALLLDGTSYYGIKNAVLARR